MEAERFDRLVRSLGRAASRRRTVLGVFAGLLGATITDPDAEGLRKGKRKSRGNDRRRNGAKDEGREPGGTVGTEKRGGKKGGGKKGGGKKGGGKKGGNGGAQNGKRCSHEKLIECADRTLTEANELLDICQSGCAIPPEREEDCLVQCSINWNLYLLTAERRCNQNAGCSGGEECCGNVCLEPASYKDDPDNCGGCGDACTLGWDCCTAPAVLGGKTRCIDPAIYQTDDENCGGCYGQGSGSSGDYCGAGSDCHKGKCCLREYICGDGCCPPLGVGRECCKGRCVEPATAYFDDKENCAICGRSCLVEIGECGVCRNGECFRRECEQCEACNDNTGECEPVSDCCTSDDQCDDGDPCTSNTCNANNVCEFSLIDECCTQDSDCDPCNKCSADNECVPRANGSRDPRCPDGCHPCHFGQCLNQCTGNNETCCGEECCGKCFVCSPDGQSCVRDPECADQHFDFTYAPDGIGGVDEITARPGELITFSLTLHADAPILPNPNDPSWGPTFVIRTCKDINPNPLQIECAGGGPAPMDTIIPGATWDVTVGDQRDGTPSVGHFSWRVPDDVPATTYEIVFLIRVPDNGESGGACCHKVWLTTAESLQVTTAGFGRVTSQPAGINCSLQQAISDCVENARVDSTIELTATPFLDAEFVEWRGCDTVDGRKCTVKMDRNRNPNAVFTGDAFFWRINGFENPSSVRARRGEELVFTMQAFRSPQEVGSAPPYEFQLWPCKFRNVSCEADTGHGTPIGNIFPGATWESTVGTHERAAVATFRWLVPEDYLQSAEEVYFVTRMATGGGGCCDAVSVGVV